MPGRVVSVVIGEAPLAHRRRNTGAGLSVKDTLTLCNTVPRRGASCQPDTNSRIETSRSCGGCAGTANAVCGGVRRERILRTRLIARQRRVLLCLGRTLTMPITSKREWLQGPYARAVAKAPE